MYLSISAAHGCRAYKRFKYQALRDHNRWYCTASLACCNKYHTSLLQKVQKHRAWLPLLWCHCASESFRGKWPAHSCMFHLPTLSTGMTAEAKMIYSTSWTRWRLCKKLLWVYPICIPVRNRPWNKQVESEDNGMKTSLFPSGQLLFIAISLLIRSWFMNIKPQQIQHTHDNTLQFTDC